MLEGIRIVEVEGLGPGPFTGMLMADLGADVIVVHRKGGSGAPGMPKKAILDRGKRSIALDLKDQGDIETFMALVKTADALIEGFRPGVMEKLGIGPVDCQKVNPRLVFGRMTGWGQDSPLSGASGHDLNYISMAGAAWYASDAGDAPFTPPTLVGDIGGGSMYLAVGLLAGIMKARATGQGAIVDAAIYDGAAHMMNLMMTLRQSGGFVDARGQSILDGPHWSRSYRTADGGYMSVQCLEPKFYAIFLDLMGLTDDEAFAQQFNRDLWPALSERLQAMFAEKPRDAWEKRFLGTDACVAPVLSPSEAAAHEMNQSRKTWHDAGGVLQAAPAPRFSGAREWTPPDSPERGEHSQEILDELADTARGLK